MSSFQIEIGSDGCPNNCAYCEHMNYLCIYTNEDSPIEIKPNICCVCGKELRSRDTYNFKDKDYCESCFGEVI